MAKVKVPLSHRPEPVEVDRDEIPGLVAQGLLRPGDVPAGEEPPGQPGKAAPKAERKDA